MPTFARLNFGGVKSGVVLFGAKGDGRRGWLVGLNDGSGRVGGAPHAPTNLGNQLEGALVRAKVGQVQAGVGLHYAHHAELGQVEPLGDGLRADDDIDVTVAQVGVAVLHLCARGSVTVKARHGGGLEQFMHLLLDALGADTLVSDVDTLTLRAFEEGLGGVAAEVAAQSEEVVVQGER